MGNQLGAIYATTGRILFPLASKNFLPKTRNTSMSGSGVSAVLRAIQRAGIHHLSGSRNRLEVQLVACDLHHHKTAIGIEPRCHLRRSFQVAKSQLTRIAEHEVIDSMLRLQSFV